jgi:predicted nucleic acid-binding protein
MAYLFDTDAISLPFRRRPPALYLSWFESVPRGQQFLSAVSLGELYKRALRTPYPDHLRNIEEHILPAVTVLPYDGAVARVFGELAADLETGGRKLSGADLQIAATAIHFDLELVTGNYRHFERVPRLRLASVLREMR